MKLVAGWTDWSQVQQSPPDDAVEKRKNYAFRHEFNEKPSIIPGCPGDAGELHLQSLHQSCSMWFAAVVTDTVLQSVPSETFGCVDEFNRV